MTTDLVLASFHHLLVFSLVGVLAMELFAVRSGLSGSTLRLLGRVDGAYGGIATAIILVGIARVIWGLKGWEFYVASHAFWAKMAAFVLVGLLSIKPTMRIIAWRKQAAADSAYSVPDSEIDAVRAFLKAEAFMVALIPVFAAAMARGLG